MGTPRLLEPADQMRKVQRTVSRGAELPIRIAVESGEFSNTGMEQLAVVGFGAGIAVNS